MYNHNPCHLDLFCTNSFDFECSIIDVNVDVEVEMDAQSAKDL
jgi:hypothetical protein